MKADLFCATVEIVDGSVRISWTPELDDAQKALRVYKVFGKKTLPRF